MNYYANERSTDYLAHYGVKGMRWGVRRAIATGNERALDKHYRKAARKLAKLQNISNPYKSAAKAAAYGAAAAGTGSIAIGGSKLASGALRKVNKLTPMLLKRSRTIGRIDQAADAIDSLAAGKTRVPVGLQYVKNAGSRKGANGQVIERIEQARRGEAGAYPILKKRNISNDTLIRIGAGAAAAGFAAKAAQNAYRVRKADKYIEKAQRWKDEMDDVFSGTDYEGSYAKMSRRQQKRRRSYY